MGFRGLGGADFRFTIGVGMTSETIYPYLQSCKRSNLSQTLPISSTKLLNKP